MSGTREAIRMRRGVAECVHCGGDRLVALRVRVKDEQVRRLRMRCLVCGGEWWRMETGVGHD